MATKPPFLIKSTTERGFGRIIFDDRYGQHCSLQDSSLAEEAAIWLGVDNTGPQIEGPTGKRNEDVGARMHLTIPILKKLLPYLQEFVEKQSYIKETARYKRLPDATGQETNINSTL